MTTFTSLPPGKSYTGEPIPAFKAASKDKEYIYLIAGTHGDEVEGIYVLKQLFSWLKKQSNIDLSIIVVPILNIDGYRNGTRVTANGVDLNRNYPSKNWSPDFKESKYHPGKSPLSEPENIFLNDLLELYCPKIIFSFHSWKPIINYNGDGKVIANYLARHNNYAVSDDIGYSTPGSLGEYIPEKYNAAVITYECPTLNNAPSLQDIWSENEKSLKNLFKFDLLQ